MAFQVRQISAHDTLDVRHAVLRQGKPLSSCVFEGDNLASTVHFGAFENNKLLGVASVFWHDTALGDVHPKTQIRGMAVLLEAQNLGLGRLLMESIEMHLRQRNDTFVWFNARVGAIAFYEKMGYVEIGSIFDVQDIGPHILMYKYL